MSEAIAAVRHLRKAHRKWYSASDKAVARRLRTTKTTVAKWRVRFNARRLAGLYDEPRVGAPRTVSDDADVNDDQAVRDAAFQTYATLADARRAELTSEVRTLGELKWPLLVATRGDLGIVAYSAI